ncbi:hypothetical protein [Amycolatopsis ultiminotia]|uniref:hypothetical protein n=1 Tax=Amycolatopsis ultiminotia TaxID=543629 RepID=UPI0031EC6B5D
MSAQSPSRQRWLIPVLVVVLSVTVAGGLLARELYHGAGEQADAIAPITVPPSTSDEPREEPGPPRVEITPDVANHPQDEVVRGVLQAYFDALNSKDYQAWSETVSDARRDQTTLADWKRDFQSTKDGSILLYRIEPGAQNSLRVLVGFTSTQSLNEAPVNFQYPCIRWRLVLPMKFERGAYRIDAVDSGTTTEHERC